MNCDCSMSKRYYMRHIVIIAFCISTFFICYLKTADFLKSSVDTLFPLQLNANDSSLRFTIEPKIYDCNKPPSMVIVVKTAIEEFEERRAIRNTWLKEAKKANIFVVFSVGTSENETVASKLIEESKTFNDILQTNFGDTYHRLVLKSYFNTLWVSKLCDNNSADVFFTDSDVILFPFALLHMAESLEAKSNIVVGHCWMSGAAAVRDNTSKSYMPVSVWPEKMYPPYCTGTGYFMRADVPKKLLQAIPDGEYNWKWAQKLDHLEDVVFTGLLRSRAKVDIKHTEMIHYNRYGPFNVCHNGTVSIHSYRPPRTFLANYDSFQKVLGMCK